MTTVRQIERHWNAKQFDRLLGSLWIGRPEAILGMRQLRLIPAVSAMAIIRLDELAQSHVPLYTRLVRTLLMTQEADGGWGDLTTTALCIRALLLGHGDGQSIDRGLEYLASLQKPSGAWPLVPIRRTDADATTTAFVLYQLADQARFRDRVRIDQALAWLDSQERQMDLDARPLVTRVRARCRLRTLPAGASENWC